MVWTIQPSYTPPMAYGAAQKAVQPTDGSRTIRPSYTPSTAYGAAEKAVQPADGSILTIDGGGRAVGRS